MHILAFMHFTLLLAHPELDTLYIVSPHLHLHNLFTKFYGRCFYLFLHSSMLNSMSCVNNYMSLCFSHILTSTHFILLDFMSETSTTSRFPISPHTFTSTQNKDLIQTLSYSMISFPNFYSPCHAFACCYEDTAILT
jgi:hypothetical protein